MAKPKSPFTKAQLLPQEEKLEIARQKGELFIGIPKETYFQEKRICLTPDAVTAITANGHKVLIENGAGEEAGFSDQEYNDAGAIFAEAAAIPAAHQTVRDLTVAPKLRAG